MQLNRPVQTRFRCASAYRLKLAAYCKSLTHYTKGTPSPRKGAPTVCRHPVSGTVSLPSSGCFSPFPHGTGPLSVTEEYLGLEGGPPTFRQGFSCPALLKDQLRFTHTGLSPAVARLSRRFRLCRVDHWPGPRSLATTCGVSVDVLSSGYLDVSVRRVRLPNLWIQFGIPLRVGCPIRKSSDQNLLAVPRSLSQRATSFIASQCQGIHQMPFKRLILNASVFACAFPARRGKTSPPRTRQELSCPPKPNRPSRKQPELRRPSVTSLASSLVKQPARLPALPSAERAIARLVDRVSCFPVSKLKQRTKYARPPRSLHHPTAPSRWWRQTGSNRRPPACKAGALPTELCPLGRVRKTEHRQQIIRRLFSVFCRLIWWAREDLNLRPHAYQARALTS